MEIKIKRTAVYAFGQREEDTGAVIHSTLTPDLFQVTLNGERIGLLLRDRIPNWFVTLAPPKGGVHSTESIAVTSMNAAGLYLLDSWNRD